MDNNNTGADKNLPNANPNQQYKGQEGENHSTASEGTLKTPDQLPTNFGTTYNEGEEQDLDDLVHSADAVGEDDADFSQGGQATPLNKEDKFTPDDISS